MTSDAVLREPGSTHGAATLTGQITNAELRSGELLGGRFRIESLLGVGGMGVVYRARDLSLDIDVALKLLRPELARKPDAFERFRKELLLARQVSSPHVVRIHDIAEAGGRWFISMDFIDGESLEGYRDRVGKIPLEGALAVTHALLDGLSAAHARGVIHRDLKPANVLLDTSGHAYITDFGVARSLGATGMTQSGIIVGTPEYLSPEQARGDPADARSDLYTTGLILYEMLTGALPFSGGTPAETVIQRIVRPPPSLAKARPDLPRWLHLFTDRLLKVSPAHRFASAKEALRALETKHVPRPPLNRRLVFALAAIVIATGGATSYFVRHPLSISRLIAPMQAALPRVAVLPFTVPADDAAAVALARAIEDHAHEWLRADTRLAVASRTRVHDALARTAPDLSGDALERRLPDIAVAANANRVLRGGIVHDNNGYAIDLAWSEPGATDEPVHVVAHGADAAGLFAAYEAAFANELASMDVRAPAAPALTPASAGAFGSGLVAMDQKKFESAATELATAAGATPPSALATLRLLDAQEKAREDLAAQNTREDVAKRFATDASPVGRELLSRALAANGDAEKSAAVLAEAAKTFPRDPAIALLDADALRENGNGKEAMARLQRIVDADDQDARAWFVLGRTAIEQAQAGRGVDDYLLHALVLNVRSGNAAAEAETRNAMGVGYEHVGKLEAAAEAYTAAAQIQEKLGDKRALAKSLRNLAIVQAVMGQRELAEKTLDRVRRILESIGDQASIADLHNDRGVVAEERGDFAAAIAAYKESLAIRRQLDDPVLIAESLDNVGFASYQLGSFDDALVYWQQALDLYRKIDDKRGLLHVEQSIGLLDIAQGHFASAGEKLRESVQKAEDAQLPEEVAAAEITLADLALLEGRYADAETAADRAQQFFARRSDERGEIETNLSKARIVLALGDAATAAKALGAITATALNAEQRGGYELAEARLALLKNDVAGARTKLAEAAKAAAESHSGTLDFRIQLEEARIALASGDRAASDATLAEIARRTTQLGQVPFRLEWIELEMASALRTNRAADVANRYREALALLRDVGRYANAYALHELGTHALPKDGREALAARAAADESRAALIAAAPAASRNLLEAAIARRIEQDLGDAR
jgi:tetratricopeptide (TPR) repeat protein